VPLPRLILLSVAALGVSAVMTQLALMQELLGVFNGNELVLGVILSEWLFLTGLGAWLGGTTRRLKHPADAFVLAQALIAILPLGQVFAVRTLCNVIFIRGADVGLMPAIFACLVLLAPYCLVSGFLLTLACAMLGVVSAAPRVWGESTQLAPTEAGPPEGGTPNSAVMGSVYVADSLGSILGGMLFSLVLLPLLDHFALLCVPAFLNLALTTLVAWRFQLKWIGKLVLLLATGLAGLLLAFTPDAVSTALQFPNQTVLFCGHSPYGRLVVTRQNGQLNFIENGVPVVSSHQTEEAEEAVHYAMVQRPDGRRVLLVGGGFSGAVAEVFKYHPAEVTYVELDPMIIEAGRRFLPGTLSDQQVKLVNTDGRLFLRQTVAIYDVVLVNLPDPSTFQLNRFYTTEFFREVKRRLSPGGVLCFALGHYENFVSPELARMLATAHRTAQSVFSHVLMIPGGRVFFIASEHPLSADIASLLEQRHITTKLVKRHYLEAILALDRLADLRRAVEQPSKLNADFNPILYFLHLRHWLSQFDGKPWLIVTGLAVLLMFYLGRLRAPAFTVFASGFAASALEVVLLLGFQVLHGSLYRQLGVVVAMFMAGLAAGAYGMARVLARQRSCHANHAQRLAWIAFAIAGLATALPFLFSGLGHWSLAAASPLVALTAVPLLTFLVGLLVGMEFPLAGALESQNPVETASRLYTADFAGACLGALLASAWLIPVWGVTGTCAFVAALNLLGGAAPLSCRVRS